MERFKECLREHGFKATGPRLAVHQAMMELGHASADMVCDKLKDKGLSVTVASVYNILSQMALHGIYQHRLSANNKMYFDVNTFKHIHIYDTFSNEHKDYIDDELIEMVESKIRRKRFKGLKVDSVDIQIICHPSHRKTKWPSK